MVAMYEATMQMLKTKVKERGKKQSENWFASQFDLKELLMNPKLIAYPL